MIVTADILRKPCLVAATFAESRRDFFIKPRNFHERVALVAIGELHPAIVGSLWTILPDRGSDNIMRSHYHFRFNTAAINFFYLIIDVYILRNI